MSIDRPQRRRAASRGKRRRKSSNVGMWVGLGIGGAALLVTAIVVIVIVSDDDGSNSSSKSNRDDDSDSKLAAGQTPLSAKNATRANWERVKLVMTESEVTQILGQGSSLDRKALAELTKPLLDDNRGPRGRERRLRALAAKSWTWWGSRDRCLVVGWSPPGDVGKIVKYKLWLTASGEFAEEVQTGDVRKLRAERTAREAERNASRWATGPEIRRLIVGKWGRPNGRSDEYEFRADGTFVKRGGTPKPYRFVDDETVSFPVTHAVFVNNTIRQKEVEQESLVRVDARELWLYRRKGDEFVKMETLVRQ